MSNIIITGASSEIGQAICKNLVKSGDNAILHYYKNPQNCKGLQKELPGKCQILQADFSDQESTANFCKQLREIDTLINAAGYTKTDLLPNITEEDILKMLKVNILAPIKICQAVIPAMIVKRRGCIVNISSVAATRGNRGQTVYAGTKGFIESFTRSLTAEYGSKGIRVNCVAPGAVNAGSLKELLTYASDDVKKSIISNRLGSPQDVATLVAFLCSDDASYINGKCIQVDGGFMRGI
jgi:3-oxoacyl-[acyl-carrier protein] reductase